MPTDARDTPEARRTHWDDVYARVTPDQVSWFAPVPAISLALIDRWGVPRDGAIIDVGGGASTLAGALLASGWSDVSVLDVSDVALGVAREQLGDLGDQVHWIAADVLSWIPDREYGVWHDRAVFHFLVDPDDRERYVEVATAAVAPGGHLVVATFALDGPERCSGLPTARYGPDELAVAFGTAFSLVASDREAHTTPAGATQAFTWGVLRRNA